MTDSLFSPLEVRGTELQNRLVMSPMCQHSAQAGVATDWHMVHLGSRAVGGAGLVMTEATAVEPRGRISAGDLGIWSDEHAEAVEPIAEFVRSQGAVPGMQLAHAGRKASTQRPWEGGAPLQPDEGGWVAAAPSDKPYPYPDDEPPETQALTTDEVEDVVAAFGAAAERAAGAGFEVVEIHGAHGYLLHEFLSPVANDRDDRYGGSFENRTRLHREVVAAVREAWPDDRPVSVRISATEWLPDRDSWTLDDSRRLAPLLAEAGADIIDVSAGGLHPDQQIPEAGPGYQVPYAEAIRGETDAFVASVGKITAPKHADAIVRNGRADLTVVGRQHLREPYLGLHAASDLGVDVEWPKQYRRAKQ
jgi:2,4-dienoyl-CoA reductase-like NADH-dependent reductase (Old Yellow Enzyme family)